MGDAAVKPTDPHTIGIFHPDDARRIQRFYREELGIELRIDGPVEPCPCPVLSLEDLAQLFSGTSGAFAGVNREPAVTCQDDVANSNVSACAIVRNGEFSPGNSLGLVRARDPLTDLEE
jgi:hypothetical protein